MKTQMFGLLFLGLTTLMYSQTEDESEAENVGLKNIVISANTKYLSEAYDENTPISVKDVEYMVATYDITTNDDYDPNHGGYLVDFKGNFFNISATYDSAGVIVSSTEKFEDILLPHPLRQALFKEYNGWDMHKNSYNVSYHFKKGAKKTYKVQLRKDGKKMNLKFDVEGTGLLAYNN